MGIASEIRGRGFTAHVWISHRFNDPYLWILKKDFEHLIDKGRLAHGYIFFGEALAVQFQFAEAAANYLENQNWGKAKTLLVDVLTIDAATSAGIDTARSLSGFLWQKPIKSPKKTLILNIYIGELKFSFMAELPTIIKR